MRTDLANVAQLKGSLMRNLIAAIVTVGMLGVGAGVASAQPAAKGGAAADKAGAAGAGKTKVYDFSGDTIEGDLVKPEGLSVDARDFAKHSSLIRIRKDFIPEIIKSAEDLP